VLVNEISAVPMEASFPEILAIGEPMVEFNQTGEAEGRLYLQGFGGDTSNFVIAAARQGARTGYITALGNDPYGAMLRRLWEAEGVDTRDLIARPEAFTAIYFVTHSERGHQFDFFRKGSAASLMTPADLNVQSIRHAKVLHLSGISLAISKSARDTCFAACEIAQLAGVKVSFDTNLRLKLWPLSEARMVMQRAIALSDICLPSLEDMTAICGLSEPETIAQYCLNLGAKAVALKLGAQGALLAEPGVRHRIAPFACHPVDATGAGDAFGGALVARLVAGDSLVEAGRYAAVVAALSTEGFGAVAPIPFAADVAHRIDAIKTSNKK
jgi:2-dehydro-3-deoxygluconokinase